MHRTLDPTFMNNVANHPEVHKWMGVEGPIDVTNVVSNPYNYCLCNSSGGFILQQHEEGVYEVHSLFVPEEGRNVVGFMKECMDYMFINTNCHTLLTQIPDNNEPAKGLGVVAGFKEIFRRKNTPRGPTGYFRIWIDEWIQKTKELEAEGEWFHQELERAKTEAGCDFELHPHDPSHERAVGAAVRMIKVGNHFKAVDTYNRWAKFAGYAPITLINEAPVVVDVVDGIVEWNGGSMEVLQCHSA